MDADAWDTRYGSTKLVWSAGPNQFVARVAEDLAAGRALDVACGEGRNAIWLAECGWDVTAVDFSPVAIDKARTNLAHRDVSVDWHVGDVSEWRPPDPPYDLVIAAYLQLAEPNRAALWPGLATVVAPGGTLLVVGHDSRNLTDGYGGPQSESVLYTADEVVAALEGFRVEKAGEVTREVALEDGASAVAIDCLVRARRV